MMPFPKRKRQVGFSLIELLIVVAIILIIAAIAIPNLLRARMAANESSAANALRTIVTAETAYASTYGIGYGRLVDLGSPGPCGPGVVATAAAACLIDPVLTTGTKSGYKITANPLGAVKADYEAAAVPMVVGGTGQRTFCADSSGAIRVDVNGGGDPGTSAACEAFPPLE